MRQTEMEKPILFGEWRRRASARTELVSQSRDVWVDGVHDPVAIEYHLAEPDGNYRDWTALLPSYWSSNVQEKQIAYLKATRPELFRKPRVRKERKPPVRGEDGKFISKNKDTEKEVVQ